MVKIIVLLQRKYRVNIRLCKKYFDSYLFDTEIKHNTWTSSISIIMH